MFELTDFSGQPLTRDYAERRARWDVLQEIVQTKGNSETHPAISPNDEFAGDLGVAGWEYGNLTLTDKPLSREMMPTNYLRAGLMRGLEQEAKLGVNPFKFGIVGSTDVHNSLTAIEEDNFFGKMPIQEPSPTRWEHASKEGFGKTRYTWHYLGAGYAAVWATENTREAMWDAMQRKEVYGTSGTRMTVRFFGGWNYQAADAKSRNFADVGYAKGVPMGGDLSQAPAGKAPTFLVAARRIRCSATSTASRSSRAGSARTARRRSASTTSCGATWSDASPARTANCPGRQYGGRRNGHVDEHDRRPGTFGRVEGPGLRSHGSRVLLRTRDRDPDAALDCLRPGALQHQDVARGANDAAGARLDVADLVHPGPMSEAIGTDSYDGMDSAEDCAMGIGTKVVANTVKGEVKDQTDKIVDKGPADKLEDKVDDKKDKVIRKTVTRPLR